MKQKINVVIHRNGSTSAKILDIIGAMNEGKANFSPRDLEGHFAIERAWMTTANKGLTLVKDTEESNTYHVSEDGGKSFTLSLEWMEVRELKTEPANDLENVNI